MIRKHIQSKLTQAFWWTLLAVSLTSPNCFGTEKEFHSLIEEIKSINPDSQMLSDSADMVQTDIESMIPDVPDHVKPHFESACVRHLELIIQRNHEILTLEYKTVIVSQRLLVLSEHLLGFELGEPFTSQAHAEYSAQITSLLTALESSKSANQKVQDTAISRVRRLLQEYQWDVLRPGFGWPLDEDELSTARDIVREVVEQTRSLAEEVGDADVPVERIFEAAEIGSTGVDKLDDLLGDRTTFNLYHLLQFNIWLSNTSELKQSISDAMPDAEQLEIAEMDRLSDEEAEAMRRENDPATIMAKNRAAAAARHEQVVAQLRSESADKSSWRPFVVANILFFLVAGGIFLWRRRTS